MTTSQTGINLIKEFEGCVLTAYKCPAGAWTIGYGHTSGVQQGQTITQAQAEAYLKSDLAIYENAVNSYVTVSLNQNQFDALVSFAYNCGTGALKTSTLLTLLNQGNYSGAANELDKWVKAGSTTLEGLVRRRAAEKALFLTATVTVSNGASNTAKDMMVKVTADVLNIRSGAGTQHGIVGTITDKGTYTITEVLNFWGKLKSGAGWISLDYTTYVGTTAANPTQAAFVEKVGKSTTDNLNVRSGPGTTYSVLRQLNTGNLFSVTGTEGSWVKIRIADGTVGYVSSQYVALV